MDYSKSSKSGRWDSDRGSSPDRRNLRETQLNDSTDIGFDWIDGDTDLGATRRDGLGATRRDGLGATRRDGLGATRRDDLGASRRDDLGASRHYDLGATQRDDLGASRRYDLGATQRNDLGATRRDDLGASRRYALGATQRDELGATRRDDLGATTRRVDLGATGDTRRENFGASGVDRLRATSDYPYSKSRKGVTNTPHYRDIAASGNYAESRGDLQPFREAPTPGLESYDYAVEDNRYEVRNGQDSGPPRRWTSLAADQSLMEEWHSMFGQIRKKWTPTPSSRMDDDVTMSKWSDDKSSTSYSTQRTQNRRAIVIIIAIVAVALLAAILVPVVVLTLDDEKDVEIFLQYEFKATISNREYTANMADPNSDEFKEVENQFCGQINENAENSTEQGFNYEGCAVTNITSGSLIITFVIVARTRNDAPTAVVVSAVIGIQINSSTDQSVASFVIVNVIVLLETPKVITSDESPAKTLKQYNGACTIASKDQCVTKHARCLDSTCKCPLGRTHNATLDSCTKINCGNEPAIANGTVMSNGSEYGSVLNISCADGFELSNDTDIICTSPTSWLELPECMPVECVEFLIPNNSEINSNSTGRVYTDLIEVTCDTGYQLDSNISMVECLANQTWSESPTCSLVSCTPFEKQEYASITPDHQSFDFNTSVTVSCDLGYAIQGETVVTCLSNGSWSKIPECTPIDCDPLEIVDAEFDPNKQPYRFSENVTVDCNAGYEYEGNQLLTCFANGSWPELPTCTPLDCDSLEIKNATFEPNMQPYRFSENVTVDCNDGYEIEGNQMVSCFANGSWPELPTCAPLDCDPLEIENASFEPDKSQFVYEENVNVSCNEGFKLQGSELISCQTDKSWKGIPTCNAIVCKFFDLPENAKIIGEKIDQYPFGKNVSLECKEGYNIQGNSMVNCQENASWTTIPSCKPIDCNNLQLPQKAINNSRISELTIDDSVYISCESGYILVGDSNMSCNTDGKWPTFSCVEANCSADGFPKPNNSQILNETGSGTLFEFRCNEGYNLVGNTTVSCISGNWSTFPMCEIVDCGPYGSIENGNVTSIAGTKYGDTVDIECNNDFKLIGGRQGSCLQNGSWTNKPVCQQLRCENFVAPENALVPENINETIVGTSFSLICMDGHDLIGADTVECQNNETWGDIPTCTPKDCGQPDEIENSTLKGFEKTTFNSTFRVECHEGYDLKGNSILECQANGSWTQYPVCEIKDCGEIGDLGNGTIFNKTGSSFGSIAYTKCEDGFDLVGRENVTCLANGKWDHLPICKETDCGDINSPEHATIGNNLEIICNEGYELFGDKKIECLNGNWSGNGTCQIVQCVGLPAIDNSDINSKQIEDSYMYKDSVDINCLDGYTINGSEKIECLANGNWSNLPICTPTDCGMHKPIGNTYEVDINGSTTFNSSLIVKCKDGLELTSISDKKVTCGSDGQWHGTVDCEIPGSISVTSDPSEFVENENGKVTCTVSDNSQWKTVSLAKAIPGSDTSSQVYMVSKNATGSVVDTNLDENYTASYTTQDDGVTISLDFSPVICENKGVYTCAVIVGEVDNAVDTKVADATVNVTCIDCGIHEPVSNKYEIDENGATSFNSSLVVTCIDGLEFTSESDKVVTCGYDGKWQGTPNCTIPGSISVTLDPPEFVENENGRVRCTVSDNSQWKTVLLAKAIPGSDKNSQVYMVSKDATGSVVDTNLDENYTVSYTTQDDGVTISLDFSSVICENEGVYTCAVIVGEVDNAIDIKVANAAINVTCIDCGIYDPISNKYEVDENGATTFNSSLNVTCNDGLEFTSESDKVVTCGSDGNWQGTPNCTIPGSISFTPNPSEFMENENGKVTCTVSDNSQWKTVSLAKAIPGSDENSPVYMVSKHATGSVVVTNLDENYTASYTTQDDGVTISLDFSPVICENKGVYTCAVIVGEVDNAIDTKVANEAINVTCIDCGIHDPISNTYEIDKNGATTFNSSLNVTCIDGLEFTSESDKVVICGSDGKWQGTPNCTIPGSISFTPNPSEFMENENGKVTCTVSDNSQWKTVSLAKAIPGSDENSPVYMVSKHATGSVVVTNLDENYTASYTTQDDGVTISLDFSPVICENKGVYTCAVIVGEVDNAIDTKVANEAINVTCIDCGIHDPISNTYEIDKNGATTFNSSLNVTCIDGLEFTSESDKVVICGSDGKWQGTPNCTIPGSISFTPNPSEFMENENGKVTCTVSDNSQWKTVSLAKAIQGSDMSSPVYMVSKNATGSVVDTNLDENYTASYTTQDDGVTISLDFSPVICENKGVYTCAVIVGEVDNAVDTKVANATVNVTCIDCGIHEPVSNKYEVDENGATTFNSSLVVTCIDGLEFTSESDKVVTCGSDGNWQGTPNCTIPGSISVTLDPSEFVENDNGKVTCTVSDNSQWETILLAKAIPGSDMSSPVYMVSKNATGSVVDTHLDKNYTVSYTTQDDGVTISLDFSPVICENKGVYTCAVIVGEVDNATYTKVANAVINVTCIDCGIHEPTNNTYTVDANASTTFNSSLTVNCIEGLESTSDSDKVLTCGSDGQWHGTPECEIPGSVLFTKDPSEFPVDGNGTLRCTVSGNPEWQTVLLAKSTPTGGNSPIADISNTKDSVELKNLDDNYTASYNIEDDGVSISLNFLPVTCENEGVYTCAVIVGDVKNATEIKFANATIDVSCTDCGIHDPITNTYEVEANGSTAFNSSLTVTCIHGLEFTSDSDKVVTCGSDGQWHGTPECKIPGSVSLIKDPSEFSVDENGTLRCNVSGNSQWQTVLLAKSTPAGGNSPIADISNATGSVAFKNLDDNYTASYNIADDGVSISLNFLPVTCENEGVYTCAVIVGDIKNATEIKFANATIDVSCTDCGIHDPITNTYEVEANGSTAFNSSLPVTCIHGLDFTSDSDKVVTCVSDGQWHGTPECKIPGSVSFTKDPSEFSVDGNGTLLCTVSGNPEWQTLLLAKSTPTGESSPIADISNATGSVEFTNLNDNYTASYKIEDDGVLISLDFLPVTCENEGVYTCAVIVGEVKNAAEIKFANATIDVPCADCGTHEPITNTYQVEANGSTTVNSTLKVTCIHGLDFTSDSDKVVTCGSDRQWHGSPNCTIPGSLSFTESSYAAKNGTALNITCIVTDYPNWQTLMLVKSEEGLEEPTTLFMMSNMSGSFDHNQFNENYSVSFELRELGASITLELDPVLCENKGQYMCAAVVGDPENATESKVDVTQLNISTDSAIPEIAIPEKIYFGRDAEVKCDGLIGMGNAGEKEGQLLLETNFGENGGSLVYNNSDTSEVKGCFLRESISASIPTSTDTDTLWAKCVIQPIKGDAISSEKKNITVIKSFVAFENSTYTFNVGKKSGFTCIVNGIPEWKRIEIKRPDGKIILGINSTDQIPDSYDSHVRLEANESSFSNDSATVAVAFDAVNCNDTIDGFGDVEFVCAVETSNLTMEDEATVTFQRRPQVLGLELSREIIQNKFTLGDRMFSCEGDVGYPQGSIEIQSNYNGKFETFLSLMPGQDNNTYGWIVNNETDTSDCKNYKKLNFAFHNVTIDWQYKRLRCVIHPSDELVGKIDELYEEKAINIIPADYCVGKSGFVHHPYFCDLNVECSQSVDDYLIFGVPKGCIENECYSDDASHCVECSSIGGCNITNVKCDKTSALAKVGDQVSFTCDIQDFDEVSYISINGEVDSEINGTEKSISVSNGIDVTVNDAYVILSFTNVTCDQNGKYIINLNNDTDVSLSLDVISDPEEPDIFIPEVLIATEITAINCSGKIGRDVDGNGVATIYLEVKFEGADNYTIVDADTTRQTEDENCEISERVVFQFTPDVTWNNSIVRCKANNDDPDDPIYSVREPIILDTPGLFCNPMLLGAQSGEALTFSCDLKDIDKITSLSIIKNETTFINESNGVEPPFAEGEEDNPFTVSIPSLKQLTVKFASVDCDQEGDYSIVLNDELSVTLTLRVIAPTTMPNLSIPLARDVARINERVEIACSGEVGRDIDGNAVTDMYIEVKYEMDSEFSIYNGSIEIDSVSDKCVLTEAARMTIYPDIAWNNSEIRCVSRNETDILESSEPGKFVVFSPNAYFENTTLTGILGESVVLNCIMKNMNNLTDIVITKGEDREIIASHSGGSSIDSVTILSNEIADDESSGMLEINITLSCGDGGKYYCRQSSSDTPSEAVSVITTEWKAETPVLDPSTDMVENNPPWTGPGYETTCEGELGTFQEASMYLESNLGGLFTKIGGGIFQEPIKDLEKCTNIAKITFHNTYTSAWNGTVLRCVIDTEDEKLMDAEYVQVIPETYCDNITDGTIITHPFDCRGILTCGGARKITALRQGGCSPDECHTTGICIPCADVAKCRPDPLVGYPEMDVHYKIVSVNGTWWHFDGNNSTLKRVSAIFQPEDDFVKFTFEKQIDGSFKIKSVAKPIYMYDGYESTNDTSEDLYGAEDNPDDDHMRFIITKETDDYYRIQTKATGRYVQLEEGSDFVSSKLNITITTYYRSLFQFQDVSTTSS